MHLGNRACAFNRLQRDLDEIKNDPFSFWVGAGDYAEYISPADKRFDAAAISPAIFDSPAGLGDMGRVLTDRLVELFDPIKDKCLGLLFGNHEAKYMREENQLGLHAALCYNLGVPDLGYTTILKLSFIRNSRYRKPKLFTQKAKPAQGGTLTLDHFLAHGAGMATTPGGKLNRLLQYMNNFRAHLYTVAHVHDEIQKKKIEIGVDEEAEHIIEHVKLGVITGSYMRTYAEGPIPSYGEARGYPPSCLGAVKYEVKPWYRQVETKLGVTLPEAVGMGA